MANPITQWKNGIPYNKEGLSDSSGLSQWKNGVPFVVYSPEVVTSYIKTINGLAKGSVKTINGLAIASVKSFNGLT